MIGGQWQVLLRRLMTRWCASLAGQTERLLVAPRALARIALARATAIADGAASFAGRVRLFTMAGIAFVIGVTLTYPTLTVPMTLSRK